VGRLHLALEVNREIAIINSVLSGFLKLLKQAEYYGLLVRITVPMSRQRT